MGVELPPKSQQIVTLPGRQSRHPVVVAKRG